MLSSHRLDAHLLYAVDKFRLRLASNRSQADVAYVSHHWQILVRSTPRQQPSLVRGVLL